MKPTLNEYLRADTRRSPSTGRAAGIATHELCVVEGGTRPASSLMVRVIIDARTQGIEKVLNVGLYPWGTHIMDSKDNYCH